MGSWQLLESCCQIYPGSLTQHCSFQRLPRLEAGEFVLGVVGFEGGLGGAGLGGRGVVGRGRVLFCRPSPGASSGG